MRTKLLFPILCMFFLRAGVSVGQLSIGNQPFFVTNATIVTVDGLSLVTDGDFSMQNTNLTLSHSPISNGQENTIKRTYTFSNPVFYHGGVGIHYKTAELNGNTEKRLQVAVMSTFSDNIFPGAQGTVYPEQSYVYNMMNLPVKVFSAMNGEASPLPVTLVRFTATRENGSVNLEWSTTSETNSSVFEIQKSGNATNWKAIKSVAASGDSDQTTDYDFVDNISPEKTFYRLKMIDRDGRFTYSKIREVAGEPNFTKMVYPNPVQDQLRMDPQLVKLMRSAEVYDQSGRFKSRLNVANENNVQGLSPGIYYLKIGYLDGSTGSFKILKH
jgi:hypothetical protein